MYAPPQKRANVPRDMRYISANLIRQRNHFEAIRNIAGKEMIADIYVRDPKSITWWFAGKVARVSDVPIEEAIARQWNLIEEHACNLRPREILPIRKKMELWIAPGDSELEVAYNRPTLQMTKMDRSLADDMTIIRKIKNVMIGFEGEVYEGGEMGFRAERTEDGFPANPEVQSGGEKQTPAQEDLEAMLKQFEEQQQNEG
uniref:Uncharacterized protein n=1 Tax=Ditylum brightwellii TaxID=49249 RepID=A0A6V2CKV0_9STRA|mmetsp:Transcript_17742/g.23669  ORF Transcript_17742/g.23669 Transcript_17742/m.23669 type:complete len:201 (-) Transcript_17742:334-936(-)